MTKWEVLWSKLEEEFGWLVNEVAKVNGAVRSSAEKSSNDFFPFRANLSFSRSCEPSSDEDLVVSVDCWLDSGVLRLSSDIALGNGYVIADGPTAELDAEVARRGTTSPEFAVWMSEVSEFIRLHRELVCAELKPIGEST